MSDSYSSYPSSVLLPDGRRADVVGSDPAPDTAELVVWLVIPEGGTFADRLRVAPSSVQVVDRMYVRNTSWVEECMEKQS